MDVDINLRPEHDSTITARLLEGHKDQNDIAIITITQTNNNDVTFYLPFSYDYDPRRMSLGRFADKFSAAIDKAFDLRNELIQKREEAEEERHERMAEEERISSEGQWK